MVSYSRVVRTSATLGAMFLKNTATVSSVGSGLHTCYFCHLNFSLNGQVIPATESPRTTKRIVKFSKLNYLPRSVPYTGSRPRRMDENLQMPPLVAALGGFFPSWIGTRYKRVLIPIAKLLYIVFRGNILTRYSVLCARLDVCG